MKKLVLVAAALSAFSVPLGAAAMTYGAEFGLEAQEVQHGGGCRKDSPRGQCCHAGSKPYHCH
ncbi:hypothetical protein PHA8399_01854 [Leisingera aquaemixtae]|uniref:YHYH domain-containing protein n=1 Tax=Leisingera aquaemixtae TaxID=1396826 RepID=A0A0P1H969_9RHOB|nr:hypothetical protein PHA8399_01854 [Leisingera aquaemixtae]